MAYQDKALIEYSNLSLERKKINVMYLTSLESSLPRVEVLTGFDWVAKRLDISNEIFLLKHYFQNIWEFIERKFVEQKVGLRVLFSIKLDNVLETNTIDDTRSKIKDRAKGRFQAEEHDHVCFPETCKKAIKSKEDGETKEKIYGSNCLGAKKKKKNSWKKTRKENIEKEKYMKKIPFV